MGHNGFMHWHPNGCNARSSAMMTILPFIQYNGQLNTKSCIIKMLWGLYIAITWDSFTKFRSSCSLTCRHNSDIIWVLWCLKSQATQLFVPWLVQANIKENIKNSTLLVDSHHKGPVMWQTFSCHEVIMGLTLLSAHIVARFARASATTMPTFLWLRSHVPCYANCSEGLVQDCSNSTANALELLQSCTKPLVFATSLKSILLGISWVVGNTVITLELLVSKFPSNNK